jgi:hypothetical protein
VESDEVSLSDLNCAFVYLWTLSVNTNYFDGLYLQRQKVAGGDKSDKPPTTNCVKSDKVFLERPQLFFVCLYK